MIQKKVQEKQIHWIWMVQAISIFDFLTKTKWGVEEASPEKDEEAQQEAMKKKVIEEATKNYAIIFKALKWDFFSYVVCGIHKTQKRREKMVEEFIHRLKITKVLHAKVH